MNTIKASLITLFLKYALEGKITPLIVYVDNIVVTGNDNEEMSKLKTYLATKFGIKDLDTLQYFKGIEVARSKQGMIVVSQRKYILNTLGEIGMLACKPIDTPVRCQLIKGYTDRQRAMIKISREVDIFGLYSL